MFNPVVYNPDIRIILIYEYHRRPTFTSVNPDYPYIRIIHNMLVLGIESSCDDTSVALLDCSSKGCFVIREFTASQIEIHKKYGGVVPEIAGRMHAEKIVPLIEETLKHDNTSTREHENIKTLKQLKPDVIAVTAGPGLITGLIVGVEAARTLSYAWDVPLVAVNHIEGHIHSVEIPNPKTQNPNKFQAPNPKSSIFNLQSSLQYPALALVVSGGHTELIYIKKQGNYKIIGQTRDDAAGECFDKVAKLLGLPYPGGPQISRLAETGRTDAINFPRPMIRDDNFDFSFAGLKTSALYWLQKNKLSATNILPIQLPAGVFGQTPENPTINDFCASFEQAIVDVLVAKTIRAAQDLKPKSIILAGGVSANTKLRETLAQQIHSHFPLSPFLFPPINYSMDNAAMIAIAGYYHAVKKDFTDWKKIKAEPNRILN